MKIPNILRIFKILKNVKILKKIEQSFEHFKHWPTEVCYLVMSLGVCLPPEIPQKGISLQENIVDEGWWK